MPTLTVRSHPLFQIKQVINELLSLLEAITIRSYEGDLTASEAALPCSAAPTFAETLLCKPVL